MLLSPKDIFKLTPSQQVPDIWQADHDAMIAAGVAGCIVDINQTLVPYGAREPNPQAMEALGCLAQKFSVCAMSNSIVGPGNAGAVRRAAEFELRLGVPVVIPRERKPSAKAFLDAAVTLNTDIRHCAVIGDRLATDIAGANRLGLYSILVDPLDSATDPTWQVALPRYLERIAARLATSVGG